MEANVSGTVQALSLTETSWEVCLKEDNKEQLRDIVIEKDMMQNALSHIDEACLLTEEELEFSFKTSLSTEFHSNFKLS